MATDLLFPTDAAQRQIARELFEHARSLPLICPHGHVDPALLADDAPFPDPARLLVVPDHYLTRMLLSQGIRPAALGVPTVTGELVEQDGRKIWQTFADHWYLFRGTPSRLWLEKTFCDVFGVTTALTPDAADEVYDEISDRLAKPEYRPRALYNLFGIEVLATTETPVDDLSQHMRLADEGWGGPGGRVITTFRPDNVVELDWPGWADRVSALGELTGEDTATYRGFVAALRRRREDFIRAGATSSDHGHLTARTRLLETSDVTAIYERGLRGTAGSADAAAFRGHMLMEFARMAVDDGLVMQLHPGAVRNHNTWLYATHGRDVGGDVPHATEYVRALRPLLDTYGNDPRFTLVLYTLDETSFSRELAPLAGGYAGVYIGAPWWFLDAPDALRRFREAVTETAGFYNTAGFVDDTRAFCSIPVRHEVARRVDAAFLARLVAEHRLPLDEAAETIIDLAYRIPRRVFKVQEESGDVREDR